MEVETVKIPADNARGYKIVNADDPRASQPEPTPAPKPRGRPKKEASA